LNDAVGVIVFSLVLLLPALPGGMISIKAGYSTQFWQSIGAWFCWHFSACSWLSIWSANFYWRRSRYFYNSWKWSDEYVVAFCWLVGLGFMFAVASLRRGHWLTRLLVSPVLLMFLIQLYVFCTNQTVTLDEVVEYWSAAVADSDF